MTTSLAVHASAPLSDDGPSLMVCGFEGTAYEPVLLRAPATVRNLFDTLRLNIHMFDLEFLGEDVPSRTSKGTKILGTDRATNLFDLARNNGRGRGFLKVVKSSHHDTIIAQLNAALGHRDKSAPATESEMTPDADASTTVTPERLSSAPPTTEKDGTAHTISVLGSGSTDAVSHDTSGTSSADEGPMASEAVAAEIRHATSPVPRARRVEVNSRAPTTFGAASVLATAVEAAEASERTSLLGDPESEPSLFSRLLGLWQQRTKIS